MPPRPDPKAGPFENNNTIHTAAIKGIVTLSAIGRGAPIRHPSLQAEPPGLVISDRGVFHVEGILRCLNYLEGIENDTIGRDRCTMIRTIVENGYPAKNIPE
jgi:hypothetical protein